MPFCLKNNDDNPHRQHYRALFGKIVIDHLQDAFDQPTSRLNNKDFTNGLTKYQCKSKDNWGFDYYKKHITKNIEGLQKAYPNIKNQQLQQEACHIAHALSKSYQILQMLFQNQFFSKIASYGSKIWLE